MRIPSGVTDQYIYFVAVDSTDFTTRETGLSSFTVYRSRNGGAAAAMTTPTINETDATNMQGDYELLLDEDMTIDAGDDAQEMIFHITHAGMATVTRAIELYRPKITAGSTLGIETDGDLTKVNLCANTTLADTVTTLTNKTGFSLAATGLDLVLKTATGAVAIAAAVWDRVLTGATHNIATSAGRRLRNIQDFGIYDMASVWVDEVAGQSTGTVDGEDATVTNRANDFDNAQTVAASVNLDHIHVQNGNAITLTATLNGYQVWGEVFTLALGGQDVGQCEINNATISGVATGTTPRFRDCLVGATTLPPSDLFNCGVGHSGGTLTLGSAGAYRLIRCYSDVAGASAPVIDMNSLGVGTTLELRGWFGGITLNNLTTNHTVTLDGTYGTITLNGADAAVEIRGIYKALANNLTGSPAVTGAGIEGAVEDAVWDEVLSGATHNVTNSAGKRLRDIQEQAGYEGGAVWVDTVNGAAGTENFINGTVNNPVDSIASAKTIADSIGLSAFRVLTGSEITLAQTFTSYLFEGFGYQVHAGGQELGGCRFVRAKFDGIFTAATPVTFSFVLFNGNTTFAANSSLLDCAFGAFTFTLPVGSVLGIDTVSATSNGAFPTFEFGDAVGNTDLVLRNWSGPIKVESMGDTGTDTVSLSGNGEFIEGTCAGGTAYLRGHFFTTSLTNITLASDNARIDALKINAECDTALTDYAASTHSAAGVWDLTDGIEASWTPRMALRVIAAACAGKLSGAASTTNTIRSIIDGKDRITATVDGDGNRSAVVLDGS